LRFGAAAGMAVFGALAAVPAFGLPHAAPFFALAAATLAVNLGYIAWSRWTGSGSVRSQRRHVDLQIAVDLVLLTTLLHYSGGVASPLLVFYLFHAFIAALLLSVRAALVVVGVSLALAGGLGALELSGALPHHATGVRAFDLQAGGWGAVLGALGVLALVEVTSVYFVATVVARLRRREEELVRLYRQLGRNEKLVAVGTLAAGLSHEINNPVGVIRNKVQILRYRIADGEAVPALHAELDVVDKHAQRIAAITQGLLAFARETPFERRAVDLDALAREAADLVRAPFANAGVPLSVAGDPAEPRARGSPNHLLQVLINLLLNALDASRAGQEVRLTVVQRADRVGLRVADRGVGIPPQDVDKIFDPFFTTKDVGKGTGLGLAISHGIVAQHAGEIEVSSQPGAGAVFTVWLPRA
jgi:two-component system NtrC family sensor kinase